MTSDTPYVLGANTDLEQLRLTTLTDLYDPGTRHTLSDLGLRVGWHCLEAGAGIGTIAAWLADQATGTGSVTATEITPELLTRNARYRIQRHDLAQDPLPENTYDLVHARAVLEHLNHPTQAFQNLAATTRPGGWLVVEAHDLSDHAIELTAALSGKKIAPHVANFLRLGASAMSRADATPNYGSRLFQNFTRAGFTEVTLQLRTCPFNGGPDTLYALSLRQLKKRLITHQIITEDAWHDLLRTFSNPEHAFFTPLLITVRGKK